MNVDALEQGDRHAAHPGNGLKRLWLRVPDKGVAKREIRPPRRLRGKHFHGMGNPLDTAVMGS